MSRRPSGRREAYVYDGAGNIKSIGNTEQYRYDASGRLTSGTIATGQTQTVTYDPYGNIKTITTAGSAHKFEEAVKFTQEAAKK